MGTERRLTRVAYSGDKDSARAHLPDGMLLLHKVREQIANSSFDLPQYSMRQEFSDGTILEARSCYGQEQLTIFTPVIPTGEEENISATQVDGFLYHPRVGDIAYFTYHTQFVSGFLKVSIVPYVKGTGFSPGGNPLPGTPVAYPLIDNDHGTRNLSKRTRTWKLFKRPPENYGNIDWKGWDVTTAAPKHAPILTWKGPPSRYFAGSLTREVIGDMMYGPNIYKDGIVFGALPTLTLPKGQGVMPFYVLGAAIVKDSRGKKWKICAAQGFFRDEESGALSALSFSRFRIVAQQVNSVSDKWYPEAPTGWYVLYDNDQLYVPSPFFFNMSGTECSSVYQFDIYTVSVNMDSLIATVNIDRSNRPHGLGNAVNETLPDTYIGNTFALDGSNNYIDETGIYHVGPNGSMFVYGDETETSSTQVHRVEQGGRVICAIDYIGDTKVTAEVTFTLDKINASANTYKHHYTQGIQYSGVPGVPVYLLYDDVIGTKLTWNIESKLVTPTVTETLYKEVGFSTLGAHNHGTLNYGTGPWPDTFQYQESNASNYENDTTATAVVFLDLRHNILVMAKQHKTNKLYSSGALLVKNNNSGGFVTGDPYTTNSSSQEYTFELIGAVGETLKCFDNFIFTQDDSTLFYVDSLTPAGGTSYKVTWTQFHWSNQPLGSWAVDRQGNYFCSQLVDGGVFNKLTGGDPVTLTEIDEGNNPVFFPIAPV